MPLALGQAGGSRVQTGCLGGERGMGLELGHRVSFLTLAPALLPACAFGGTCFPGTMPQFPSFLAGGKVRYWVSAKHLECCWQVFLPGLTLSRKILPCSAGGRASRRLVAWDASLQETLPASFPFPCCHPRAVTHLLGCWLTDGFALKQMLPALLVQGHPYSHPTPHPPQLPLMGRILPFHGSEPSTPFEARGG